MATSSRITEEDKIVIKSFVENSDFDLTWIAVRVGCSNNLEDIMWFIELTNYNSELIPFVLSAFIENSGYTILPKLFRNIKDKVDMNYVAIQIISDPKFRHTTGILHFIITTCEVDITLLLDTAIKHNRDNFIGVIESFINQQV